MCIGSYGICGIVYLIISLHDSENFSELCYSQKKRLCVTQSNTKLFVNLI